MIHDTIRFGERFQSNLKAQFCQQAINGDDPHPQPCYAITFVNSRDDICPFELCLAWSFLAFISKYILGYMGGPTIKLFTH